MELEFIKKDSRVFVIKPNPLRKTKLKVMKESYMRDPQGKPIKRAQDDGYKTQTMEIDTLVIMPGATHTFTPARRPDNGVLLTGLDVLILNPYKDEPYYSNEFFEKALKGKEKALLQHILEYEHGVEFDYYTANIKPGLIPKEKRKFFETEERFFKLGNGVSYLKMSNPRDRVMYYALTARHPEIVPMVAKNLDELQNGGNAQFCRWYFVDEEEKQNRQVSALQARNRVIAAIENLREHKSNMELVKMAKAIGLEAAKDLTLNNERAYVILNNEIVDDSVLSNLFMDYYELWKDDVRRPFIDAYAEIFDYVLEGLIRVKNGKYEVIIKDKKGNSEIKLFSTKDQLAKEYILDPAYKESVADIKSSLKAKRM